MTKNFLFFILLLSFGSLLNAQTTYYVETTGDDANDGLTEVNAFATVSAAFAAVKAGITDASDTEFIISIGDGTFDTPQLSFAGNNANVTVTFKGDGASTTTLDGGSDNKLFNNLSGDNTNKQFEIILENATFSNFSNAYTGGIINFNGAAANQVSLTANRCVFSSIDAATGAIVRSNHASAATFKECSFIDITSTGTGGIIHMDRGNVTIENCYFDNCVREYADGATGNTNGIIMHSLPLYAWVKNTNLIVNNTIVNSGATGSLGAITAEQRLISIYNKEEGTKADYSQQDLTFANNLIMGSVGVDFDVYAFNTSDVAGDYVYNTCTNNIFSTLSDQTDASSSFPTAGNTINPALTFTSTEIDFMMDGAVLDLSTTSDGLIYAVAKGTSVVDGGLTSVQTTVDIVGTTRSTPGDIGAVEYVPAGGQFITFNEIDAVRFSQASAITLGEFSSAGLTITYTSSDESVATVSGNVITPVGEGKTTISANQAGNGSFDPAPEIQRELYLAPETLMLYVRATGDNANDGLSEGNAFATLGAAATAAVNDGVSIAYIVDIDGTITNNAATNFSFNRADNISVTVKGAGADQTIYQMVNDTDYDVVLEAAGRSAGRVFPITKNAGAGNLTLLIEDMTFRNFGFTNDNGGALFNLNQAGVIVDITMKNCNIERGVARSGALLQANNGTHSFTLESCFVSEMTAINKNTFNSPITFAKDNSFSATNCVFHDCEKVENQYQNSMDAVNQGTVITFQPNVATPTLTLVNNTFVGDSSLRVEMTVPQATVVLDGSAEANVTIANNLFVGGYAASAAGFFNVYVTGTAPTFSNSTNNVMLAQSGFVDENNVINAGFTYTSPEINFSMNGGDVPNIMTAASGVNYVAAYGSEIQYKGASGAFVPTMDITGATRVENTTVGATEVGYPTTIASSANNALLSIYGSNGSIIVKGEATNVNVYNVVGVLQKQLVNNSNFVSIPVANKGIYIVVATTTEGQKVSQKVVVQ